MRESRRKGRIVETKIAKPLFGILVKKTRGKAITLKKESREESDGRNRPDKQRKVSVVRFT